MQHEILETELSELDEVDALADRIASSAATVDATMHQLLTHIRRFDELKGWARQGAKTCAHWLSWRVGDGLVAAREKVRVARALGTLPLVDALSPRVPSRIRRCARSHASFAVRPKLSSYSTRSIRLARSSNKSVAAIVASSASAKAVGKHCRKTSASCAVGIARLGWCGSKRSSPPTKRTSFFERLTKRVAKRHERPKSKAHR